MSNLENFKKQAKQYLRWHREQYYPVAAIIRRHVPRFRQLSDREILAAAFPVFVGDIRERESLLSAAITLESEDEIKQLFLTYKAAGVPLPQALSKEPWGSKTFIVKDPDGNLILFAAPAS